MAPSALSPATGSYEHRSTTLGKPHLTNGHSDRLATAAIGSPPTDGTQAIKTIQQTFENALAAITTLPEENRTLKAEILELKAKLDILEAEKRQAEKIATRAQGDLAREKAKHAEQNEQLQILANSFTLQYETFKAGPLKKHEGKNVVLEEANAVEEEGKKSMSEINSLEEKLRIDQSTCAKEKEAWDYEKHDFLGRIRHLEDEISSLETEHRLTLAGADRRNDELFLLKTKLELDVKDLKKQNFEMQSKIKKKTAVQIEDYGAKRDMYDQEYRQLERQRDGLIEELAEVKEDLTEAQRQSEKLKPLLKKAVEVRVCFLARAKEDVLKSPAKERDVLAKRAGDAAEHQADGATDALMLTAGLVEDPEVWFEVFEDLYGTAPSNFQQIPLVYKRIKDCEASLRTSPLLKGGRGPVDLRGQAQAHLVALNKLYANGASVAENSPEMKKIVEDLEKVTAKLMVTNM